jgi:hypothetical protein
MSGMSRTQSYTLGFFALAAMTIALGWFGKSMIGQDTASATDFWHAGYFRDEAMNRLFTVAYQAPATEQDVREYAAQLTYTPGQTTVAFFYAEGSRIPSAGITDASSLADAKQAMRTMPGASPWRYAALKNEQGELRLVDCEASPGDSLCRH